MRRRKGEKKKTSGKILLAYQNKKGKIVERETTVKDISRYGKVGKNKQGIDRYAVKRKYLTKSGKIVRKARLINKNKLINLGGYYADFRPEQVVEVKISTKKGVVKRFETMNRLKGGYYRDGNKFKKKPGVPRERKELPPKDSRPYYGDQVLAIVTFKYEDRMYDKTNGVTRQKGDTVKIAGYSKVQTKAKDYSIEEMEAQAINYAISQFCKANALDSKTSRSWIIDIDSSISKVL